MDVRAFFLYLHHANHFTGVAKWTLAEPMVAHYRTVLPGHNSVAWLLWHIARGEDWAVQTILQEGEQLLTRDGWDRRLGISEPSFGGGMGRAAMISLTKQIDLTALRAYYDAVADATQQFLATFDFATLAEPFDVQRRLALAPEAEGPSAFLRGLFRQWTTPLVWLEVFALVDVSLHMGEAEHVLNLVVPDREIV